MVLIVEHSAPLSQCIILSSYLAWFPLLYPDEDDFGGLYFTQSDSGANLGSQSLLTDPSSEGELVESDDEMSSPPPQMGDGLRLRFKLGGDTSIEADEAETDWERD